MSSPLSQYFTGVGAKRLSDVEVKPAVSNQHEFNGIADFKNIFGVNKINFKGQFIYLADDDEPTIESNGSLTWYDARESHETRTEFRLYYSTNFAIDAATTGDLVVIGRTGDNQLAAKPLARVGRTTPNYSSR